VKIKSTIFLAHKKGSKVKQRKHIYLVYAHSPDLKGNCTLMIETSVLNSILSVQLKKFKKFLT